MHIVYNCLPVIQHLRYDPNNTNVQDAGTCLGTLAVHNPRFRVSVRQGTLLAIDMRPQLLWMYVLCALVTYQYMLQIQCLCFKHAGSETKKKGPSVSSTVRCRLATGVSESHPFLGVVFQNAYGCFQKIGVLQIELWK